MEGVDLSVNHFKGKKHPFNYIGETFIHHVCGPTKKKQTNEQGNRKVEFCSIRSSPPNKISKQICIWSLRLSPFHWFTVTLREGTKSPEMVCDVLSTTKTKTKTNTKITSTIGSWYLTNIAAASVDVNLQVRRNIVNMLTHECQMTIVAMSILVYHTFRSNCPH